MKWVSVEKQLPPVNKKYGESDYVLGAEKDNIPVVCWYHKKDGWKVAH